MPRRWRPCRLRCWRPGRGSIGRVGAKFDWGSGLILGRGGAVADLNRERGSQLRLRIGLNSGPVVAGVIGRQKFSYDLWGSTVNIASRMQSSALPDRVNVSAATQALLSAKFKLSDRGTVSCK